MSFRYMNPGKISMFADGVGTQVTDTACNPCEGVAFWRNTKDTAIRIPEQPSELYIHVSFSIEDGLSDACEMRFGTDLIGVSLEHGNSYYLKFILYGSAYRVSGELPALKKYNDMILKISTGSNASQEIILNGKSFKNNQYDVSKINQNLYFYSNHKGVLLSNIIVSDQPIKPYEQVVSLPLTNIQTDRAVGEDGTYEADTEGEYYLGTPSVEKLLGKYGGNTKVTGLGHFLSTAYTTGDVLNKLNGICKKDGTIQKLGTSELGKDATKAEFVGATTDMTLTELSKCQIGLQAGV